jgi:hypothetical protein
VLYSTTATAARDDLTAKGEKLPKAKAGESQPHPPKVSNGTPSAGPTSDAPKQSQIGVREHVHSHDPGKAHDQKNDANKPHSSPGEAKESLTQSLLQSVHAGVKSLLHHAEAPPHSNVQPCAGAHSKDGERSHPAKDVDHKHSADHRVQQQVAKPEIGKSPPITGSEAGSHA